MRASVLGCGVRRECRGGGAASCRVETALRQAAVDGVPDQGLDADTVEAVDLLDAGRRGDVDLGQVIAEHVDADEDQPALAQRRADRPADLQIADPPPLKWSTLMYVTGIEEDRYAEEALQAGRDRHEAAPG